MSIGAAFRQSFRPLDLRGDLRALPEIAIRSKALWLPALLTVASAIAFYVTRVVNPVPPVVEGQPAPEVSVLELGIQFMFTYFVQTPAIGGVFLAGFLAPRASWLLGFLVGLLAAICYSALVVTAYAAVSATTSTPGIVQDVIISSFVLSPFMGILFASAAAWYRRFLQYTNPNRGRPKTVEKRGPDGRSRGTNAKAAPTRR
jgi:hypothetical protein